MSTRVHPLRDEDREGLYRVWSLTYNSNRPFDDPAKAFRYSDHFVAERDGEVVGAYGVMPMTASRGPAELQCAGILAVAVKPLERKSGIGSKMMRTALRDYRDKGFELANLYAFRETYYRRFGYEIVGIRYKISVDPTSMPRFEASLPVRQFGIDCLEHIRDCYEEFAFRRSGMNLRRHEQWNRILNPDTFRTVYAAGDPVEAYIVLQHSGDFWEEQHIEEFVWTSRRGYDTMLDFLTGIGMNKSKINWYEPSDSPYHALYWDRGADIAATTPRSMFRVLNVPKALAGLKPEAEGDFTIEVFDAEMPENQGPWRVHFSPAGVEVTPTDHAAIRMDVRRFAQAFLGEPALAQLWINDLVEVDDRAQAEAACRLMPHSPTLCLEFF